MVGEVDGHVKLCIAGDSNAHIDSAEVGEGLDVE